MKRLENETSPYLLQHAANPVDWYAWGPDALAAAKTANKPILLSVGYSACHWCHVMAHESFENEQTAQLMNDRYINVKVDREERPDLDQIYQLAHQLLTQRPGGWPLTMFLTPDDQLPFFGGTYFPDEARHGLPSFNDILVRVSDYFKSHRNEIDTQNRELKNVYEKIAAPSADTPRLSGAPLNDARSALEQQFDSQYGGFGRAPKFPHAGGIERLLRHWRATAESSKPDLRALYMATFSLKQMSQSGLFDQLAGGFYRYAVDETWTIPHFEKMLYDNALLLALYASAGQGTGDVRFLETAARTADWMLAGLHDPRGAFYATLDADSEGEEGKYYVWQKEEIVAALTTDELDVFAARFGLDGTANFEGAWHLVANEEVPQVAVNIKKHEDDVRKWLASAREKLLAIRAARVPPHRDEKLLTAWNALTVRGLAIAARALNRGDLAQAATRVINFTRENLYRDGRLLASYKDGRARFNGYLDDYAYLIDAIVELLQTRWESKDLAFATELADTMLRHFEDSNAGGFFFTSDDHEALIQRPKPFADDATPAGNGVAARALLRLGALLGETRYLDAAERTLQAGYAQMAQSPSAHNTLIDALDDFINPLSIVVVRYDGELEAQWQQLALGYDPKRLTFFIPADAENLPDALALKRPGDVTTAYVCQGLTCSEPAYSPGELMTGQARSG